MTLDGVLQVVRSAILVVLVALAAAPDAAAKCCTLVGLAPDDLTAGEEWTATIRVRGSDAYWHREGPPSLIAWSDSTPKAISEEARRSDRRGIYQTTVVFPEAGVWSYTVAQDGFRGGGGGVSIQTVTVSERDRWHQSLPVWWVLAGVAFYAMTFIIARPTTLSRDRRENRDASHTRRA
jgi:hypothetical protein